MAKKAVWRTTEVHNVINTPSVVHLVRAVITMTQLSKTSLSHISATHGAL